MKFLYISVLLLLFTGCDLLESQEDQIKKEKLQQIKLEKKVSELKDVKLKQLSLETQKELAILESKKELATIEKEKELEKIRLNAELQKQKIILENDKEKAAFDQDLQKIEQMNNMELKRYGIFAFVIFMIIVTFFIYYYFKKRHENQLLAYKDNLEKYFHQKENDTKLRIAEKMLDTIAAGQLDKNQETQLISAFGSQLSQVQENEQLEVERDDDTKQITL